MRTFTRLALTTAAATFLLIVLGGVVRATGAGLACPDWPLCHGRLIPPFEPLVLIEYSHRLAAAIVGVLTVVLTVTAVRRFSLRSRMASLAGTALALLAVQIALGALTVRQELSAWIVVAHLGTAMAFFAVLVTIATTAMLGQAEALPSSSESRVTSHESRSSYWRLAALTLAATYVLVLIGGYVSASGAGLACPDWPLCYGRLLPPMQGPVAVHFYHRLAAAVVTLLIVTTAAVAYRTQTRRPQLLAASAIAVGLLVLQVILGALNVEFRLADSVTTAHLATAAALFATLVVLLVLARRVPETASLPEPVNQGTRPRMARVLDYVALTKPRIMILLLVTTFSAMLIAAPGQVSPWIVAVTLLGGALASGSASAINQLLERDIDALMARTKRRPVAAGRIKPPFAFAFATVLGFVAFAVLSVFVNLLTAVLAITGLFFYVLVYTAWLKRLTPQNIVIGGAAGAVPPLVGWAAATGRIDFPAVVLFLIVFLWTPPHFWALSLYRREDYARAGVPMLPVVAGEEATRRQIVVYSTILVVVSLLLFPIAGLGVLYAAVAGLSGALFIVLAFRVWREKSAKAAVRLFGYSILYLGILFAAMVLDRLLGLGPGA
ncbi:MAG TPA: heme o synthase [bacterium]|nr:heme o synthase [bacterium]